MDRKMRGMLLLAGVATSATIGAVTSLNTYVKHEIERRGYPSWEVCQCDFKLRASFFQVFQSRYEQRGATIVAQEWGLYLSYAPQWMRRFLHQSAQYLATLNPRGRYVERMSLSPQEAQQLATLLRSASSTIELPSTNALIVWRHEILHAPRSLFDSCVHRLYPTQLPQERVSEARPLPTLWDPHRDLPLPSEGSLLSTPTGTRIDYIGWTPSQISFCTARLHAAPLFLLYKQAL